MTNETDSRSVFRRRHKGALSAWSYLHYVSTDDARRSLTPSVADGTHDIYIREMPSVENTIPNVSAALLNANAKLDVLARELERVPGLRIGGVCTVHRLVPPVGCVAFSPRRLNPYRRYTAGLTLSKRRPAPYPRDLLCAGKRGDTLSAPSRARRGGAALSRRASHLASDRTE